MEVPEVNVEKISGKKAKELLTEYSPRGVNLGCAELETKSNSILSALVEAMLKKKTPCFLLTWEGNKVPRGACVANHKIAWTQHGEVVSEENKKIGIYERLVEFGGETGKTQKMIVFLFSTP